MTEITLNTSGMPARTIEQITASVRMNTQAAGMHLLQIGQDMLDAKALLDFGQWLPWLKSVGYSARTAENWMRIAREVSPDSTLAGLPQAKVLALLALPAEEREEFVQENAVEDKSAAEIRRLIAERDQLKRERDSVSGALNKVRDELAKERACAEHLQDELQDRPERVVTVHEVPDDYQELKRKAQRYDQDLADAAQAAVEAEERARALARELERAQAGNDQKDPIREAESAANDFLILANMLPYQPELVAREGRRLELLMKPIRAWVLDMQKALMGTTPYDAEGAVS